MKISMTMMMFFALFVQILLLSTASSLPSLFVFLLLLLLAREFANRYVFVPLMTTKDRKGEQKVNTRPIKFLNFFNKCENASFEDLKK